MDTLPGYLRLYCAIYGVPEGMSPPRYRCRGCGGETDEKYKARRSGNLCLKCYQQRNKERAALYYARYPDRCKAHQVAKSLHPVRQGCSIVGCCALGQRHHPDYDRPEDIVWLCRYHHGRYHLLKSV